MNLDHVLKKVKDWVEEVADYQLKEIKQDRFLVESKGTDVDMVTNVDKHSEEMIVNHIKSTFPDHGILGEESGHYNKKSDYIWVIDPIDGTTNFVHGYPMHCISVGLKYRNETVLGLVLAPVVGYEFYAIKGRGAFLNGKKISVTNRDKMGESVIATGFPYSRRTNNMNLPYFNKIVNEVAGIRRSGSAALDLCMVAAGMLDAYWEFFVNEWDIIAGRLFVEEAGGLVTYVPHEGTMVVVAANKQLHNQLKTIIGI